MSPGASAAEGSNEVMAAEINESLRRLVTRVGFVAAVVGEIGGYVDGYADGRELSPDDAATLVTLADKLASAARAVVTAAARIEGRVAACYGDSAAVKRPQICPYCNEPFSAQFERGADV